MKFTRAVLPNGLTVLHEYRDVPVTSVAFASRLGAAYEKAHEKGISHFLEHMCFKGTPTRSVADISSSLENVGGNLNAFTDECITCYHVKVPSNHDSLALEVMADLYFNPLLNEEEMKKEAKVICEEIKMYHDDPESYTDEQLKLNLYGLPFGLSIAGDEKTVLSMTRNDLAKKHSEHYQPSNSILGVVGNTPLEKIFRFADSFVFPSSEPCGALGVDIERKTCRTKEAREGIEQTNFAMGFHFPNGLSQAKYAAVLFNTILGGGMSSKLFMEVREKRGLAYSIYSHFSKENDFGYLGIFAGTKAESVPLVEDLVLQEIRSMSDLSEEALAKAKERVIGLRRIGVENSMLTADRLIRAEMSSSAEDVYNFEDCINRVSLEDVRALADVDDYASFVLSPK